jgi:drug/metabolite transporter (DMT)-like permease
MSFTGYGWLDVAAGAFTNVIGQNFMTVANQYSNPGVVAILNYVGVLYTFGLDRVFFDVQFTNCQLLGISIICCCNICIVCYKLKKTN